MNKKEILKELYLFSRKYERILDEESVLEETEKFLQEQLKDNPRSTFLLLRLATVWFTIPWQDSEMTQMYLEKILSYDPYNSVALIIMVYAQYIHIGIQKETIERLDKVKVRNPAMQSLIYYAQSLYFITENRALHYQYLLKSINLFPRTVWPYLKAASYLFDKNQIIEGKSFLIKGLKNVKTIGYVETTNYDCMSVKYFFETYITGTRMSRANFNRYLEALASC